VQGLSEFEHHIVGGVHDGVDGAHACGEEAVLHLCGRGDGLDVADDARGVARAKVRVANLHAGVLCGVQRLGMRRVQNLCIQAVEQLGRARRLAQQGVDLPRDAENAQAVAAIGRDIHRQHRAVRGVLYRFHFQPRHRQPLGEVFRRQVYLHKVL
jgi:hypothetical protein